MSRSKSQPTVAACPGDNRTCIETLPLAELRTQSGDPRRHSNRDVTVAAKALRALPVGALLPIVVNRRGEVLVGHVFVQAARQIGCDALPVIRHDGMTELEEKQYTVAITQLLGKGSWDPEALSEWVREFEGQLTNFSHAFIGFDNGELDRILGIPKQIAGGCADDVPAALPDAVSRPGMLWQLGRHRLLVGDATSNDHMNNLMATSRAKLVMTDPPFGCAIDGFVAKKGKHRNFVQGAGEMSRPELECLFLAFASNLARVLEQGALVYVFIDWRSFDLLQRACEVVFGPLVQLCCWVKNRAGMGSLYRSQHELVLVFRMPGAQHANNVQLGRNGRNRTNVWDYPSAASSRSGREGDMLKLHPTPKTVEMIADAILDSTEPGDRVIDCFLGSGTTLIAAERTGRICHGMDLDPLYVDVAIRRWQQWTGELAIEVEAGQSFDYIAAERAQAEEQADA